MKAKKKQYRYMGARKAQKLWELGVPIEAKWNIPNSHWFTWPIPYARGPLQIQHEESASAEFRMPPKCYTLRCRVEVTPEEEPD
jgi:hypothetical protein